MTLTLTSMRWRWLMGSTLLAGLVTVSWKYGGEPATAAMAKTGQTAAVQSGRPPDAALPELELEKLELDKSPEPITDAFEPRSWIPPPPKFKAPPPPPPQAPPLPFTYIGKMLEDGKVVVFLTSGQRNYTVRSGDKLDDTYQVDDIKPTTMLLTYLPLNVQQSLMIGSAN
jgi:hypothetical protein